MAEAMEAMEAGDIMGFVFPGLSIVSHVIMNFVKMALGDIKCLMLHQSKNLVVGKLFLL